jgi:Uma2 family endonuclease
MNAPLKKMTVPEFLAWAESQPRGRFELVQGQPVQMAAERVLHLRSKHRVAVALERAAAALARGCHMLPGGATVAIDEETAYEPDALVYCGAPLGPDAMVVTDPLVVVEVVSPSSERTDTGAKLAGYFKCASIAHYLIVDPAARVVVRHSRGAGDAIETRILMEGAFRLDPPGLDLTVEDLLPAA